MDQFPHDDWPKHMDQPRAPRRDIHARVTPDHMVRVSWSPVRLGGFQKLTLPQAVALMYELAQAVTVAEPSPASMDLERSVQHAVQEWEAHND